MLIGKSRWRTLVGFSLPLPIETTLSEQRQLRSILCEQLKRLDHLMSNDTSAASAGAEKLFIRK